MGERCFWCRVFFGGKAKHKHKKKQQKQREDQVSKIDSWEKGMDTMNEESIFLWGVLKMREFALVFLWQFTGTITFWCVPFARNSQ